VSKLWSQCLIKLEQTLTTQKFNMSVRPLEVIEENGVLRLIAPNSFIMQEVSEKILSPVQAIVNELSSDSTEVRLELSAVPRTQAAPSQPAPLQNAPSQPKPVKAKPETTVPIAHSLNRDFTFESFVQGKENQMAVAAAESIADKPGGAYNPFVIYGGVGLGKTHLMHAVGNAILRKNPSAKVIYLTSEEFVNKMTRAIQKNQMNEFKKKYRSADALLIDDIQFIAGKDRTQEEFFHTFNVLLEGNKQVVLTSDRFPKRVEGLEERLKSRFNYGLTIEVEPPELEMRSAIVMKKAALSGVDLPDEVAFFIAQNVRSNVRELEGALKKVLAHAQFTGQKIDLLSTKEALRDILSIQQKMISLDNIQKTVADYFKISVRDILSKSRSRSVARPRQIAMSLAKELTNHSYPEIGDAFGGRDHTTVMHSCKKVKELQSTSSQIDEDYNNLTRILSN